jgi:hypothetical protein
VRLDLSILWRLCSVLFVGIMVSDVLICIAHRGINPSGLFVRRGEI